MQMSDGSDGSKDCYWPPETVMKKPTTQTWQPPMIYSISSISHSTGFRSIVFNSMRTVQNNP